MRGIFYLLGIAAILGGAVGAASVDKLDVGGRLIGMLVVVSGSVLLCSGAILHAIERIERILVARTAPAPPPGQWQSPGGPPPPGY